MSFCLDGKWKAYPDPNNKGESLGFYGILVDDSDWYDINVPGHWQEEIEDLREYTGVVWYRRKFSYEKKKKIVWLRFNGVFYKTTVWLNEKKLGCNEGYFFPFKFNITEFIRNENTLAVKVESYDEKNLNKKVQVGGVFYHWDCRDPTFNPGGIWRSVEIYETGNIWVERIKIITKEIRDEEAILSVLLWLGSDRDMSSEVLIEIKPHNFQGETQSIKKQIEVKKGECRVELTVRIKEPKLWWTWDLGPQHLYRLDVYVLEDGEISDQKTEIIGIREIRLERSKKGWVFYLNGKRLFIRGTNYGPTDQRIAYVSREMIERDVKLMREANINMVRIHAQINPETLSIFDEYGILVWQDMPLQWMYSKKIKNVVTDNARQLVKIVENHPSVAVINCHNEPFKIPTKSDAVLGALAFVLSLLISLSIGSMGRSLEVPIPYIEAPYWSYMLDVLSRNIWFLNYGAIISLLVLFALYYPAIALATGGYEGILICIILAIIMPWDVIIFLTIFLLISGSPVVLLTWNWNKNVLDKYIERLIRFEDMDSHPIVRHSGIMGWFIDGTDIHIYDGWYTGWLCPFRRCRGYRHAKQFTGIFKRVPRFVTEYGAQAFPCKENLLKMLPDKLKSTLEKQDFATAYKELSKYLKKYHQYQPEFMRLWLDPKKFKTIDDFIEATQRYQAELIKFYNEYWRSRRFRPVGGALQFMFTDIAPLITWAVLDYWRKPKEAYYALKETFRPVYIFMEWPKIKYKAGKRYKFKIYIVNDLHKRFNAKAYLYFDGDTVWEKDVVIDEDSIKEYEITYRIPSNVQGKKEIKLLLETEEEKIVNKYEIEVA